MEGDETRSFKLITTAFAFPAFTSETRTICAALVGFGSTFTKDRVCGLMPLLSIFRSGDTSVCRFVGVKTELPLIEDMLLRLVLIFTESPIVVLLLPEGKMFGKS
jgi:hypothetical protein